MMKSDRDQIESLREKLTLFSQNRESLDDVYESILNMEISSHNKETILDICSEVDADPESFAQFLYFLHHSATIDDAVEMWDKS